MPHRVTSIKRKVKARFLTRDIDKHRTSQICPDCHTRLEDVAVQEDGRQRKVMGLKWCPSEQCKHNPLKIRDELACYNIFQKGEDSYHPIFDYAEQGDEHYWGTDPDVHLLTGAGMTASRKHGYHACGKVNEEEDERLERKRDKAKRKRQRKKRNRDVRLAQRMAALGL